MIFGRSVSNEKRITKNTRARKMAPKLSNEILLITPSRWPAKARRRGVGLRRRINTICIDLALCNRTNAYECIHEVRRAATREDAYEMKEGSDLSRMRVRKKREGSADEGKRVELRKKK